MLTETIALLGDVRVLSDHSSVSTKLGRNEGISAGTHQSVGGIKLLRGQREDGWSSVEVEDFRPTFSALQGLCRICHAIHWMVAIFNNAA